MKYCLVIVLLFQGAMLFAANTYTISYTFKDNETHTEIKGLTVELRNDKDQVLDSKVTDKQGLVQFLDVSVKFGKIEIVDVEGYYVVPSIIISNTKMKSIEETIGIFPSVNWKEEKFKAAMTERNLLFDNDEPIWEYSYNDSIICADKKLVETGFPGGAIALQQYIASHVLYPQEAIELNEQGRVYITMIIEKDGSITHISIAKKTDSPSLNYEAKRLMFNCPKWIAATCDGENVRSRATFPINFTLN